MLQHVSAPLFLFPATVCFEETCPLLRVHLCEQPWHDRASSPFVLFYPFVQCNTRLCFNTVPSHFSPRVVYPGSVRGLTISLSLAHSLETPPHPPPPSHWSVYYPGIVFFHRFYMLQSFANNRFNRWYMAVSLNVLSHPFAHKQP